MTHPNQLYWFTLRGAEIWQNHVILIARDVYLPQWYLYTASLLNRGRNLETRWKLNSQNMLVPIMPIRWHIVFLWNLNSQCLPIQYEQAKSLSP